MLVATCGELTLGHEQYLRLTIELPTTETLDGENRFTHIIVVPDRSGSMAGNPWKQVYINTQINLHEIYLTRNFFDTTFHISCAFSGEGCNQTDCGRFLQ